MKTLSTLLLPILLCGCGLPLSPSAIEQRPEGAFLKQTIERLVARDFAPIEATLDPELKIEDVKGSLERTAAYFPQGKPKSIRFTGWNYEKTTGQDRRTNLTVEYGYGGDQWVLVTAQLRGEPGSFRIWGLHVERTPQSLSALNAFTFAGKGPIHYFVVVAMALAFGVTVYALVLCLRTAGLRKKWLWVIFILFGVCSFTLNWTTGEFKVALLNFNLFSAGAFRMGFAGPWMLTFCIPLGAMAFISRRRRLAEAQGEAAAAGAKPETPPSSLPPDAGSQPPPL